MSGMDTYKIKMEDVIHINGGEKGGSETCLQSSGGFFPAVYVCKVFHLSFVSVNSTNEGP